MPLLILFLLLLATPAQALNLSRNLPTSTRDMEFFYMHKKNEVLPGILRTLEREKMFTKGEVRLSTAAFLAQIFKNDPLMPQYLQKQIQSMSLDAQSMFLLALHLSNSKPCFQPHFSPSQAEAMRLTLKHCPTQLTHWDLYQSSAILHMYWCAFFALGDYTYLDPIIQAALTFAELKA
ncbi:MAG: hypothetical protein IK079_00075, partial [Desulfovibrio sp.]|nr:hypothetical protein [Desulfovibrio sp.]